MMTVPIIRTMTRIMMITLIMIIITTMNKLSPISEIPISKSPQMKILNIIFLEDTYQMIFSLHGSVQDFLLIDYPTNLLMIKLINILHTIGGAIFLSFTMDWFLKQSSNFLEKIDKLGQLLMTIKPFGNNLIMKTESFYIPLDKHLLQCLLTYMTGLF